jgi:hypothetical protein
MSPEQARRAFIAVLTDCGSRDELQEALGYDCVDSGTEPGVLGSAVPEYLFIELGRDNLWPVGDFAGDWDDDTLFDMMEFWFDHVSTGDPEAGRHHTFDDCGWHYSGFTAEPARSRYRNQINKILARIEPGYELTDEGEIVRATPDGVTPLLKTASRLVPGDQRAHVEAAVTKYRARSSTTTDRRDAVRDLADVLENLRSQVHSTMPSKDEALLFETANKFWIRHNKPGERRDYDHEAWWSWLFYVYLASIALVTHLSERVQPATRQPASDKTGSARPAGSTQTPGAGNGPGDH